VATAGVSAPKTPETSFETRPTPPAVTRLLVEEVAERWERHDDVVWFEVASVKGA
jgi:hypothetical protein